MSVNFFNGIFNNNSKVENHHNTEDLKERYDLIARILNAKTNNEGLEEYQSVLDDEFLEFASGGGFAQRKGNSVTDASRN
ncbi:hypothetical protein E5L50_04800 [Helicobacter pylori]|nr:hypothetical protein E5L50_04800 [Helicobacter pylori]